MRGVECGGARPLELHMSAATAGYVEGELQAGHQRQQGTAPLSSGGMVETGSYWPEDGRRLKRARRRRLWPPGAGADSHSDSFWNLRLTTIWVDFKPVPEKKVQSRRLGVHDSVTREPGADQGAIRRIDWYNTICKWAEHLRKRRK